MKYRIAKKILQGRSSVNITVKRAVNLRKATRGSVYAGIAKTITYGVLYGGSSAVMRKLIKRENSFNLYFKHFEPVIKKEKQCV